MATSSIFIKATHNTDGTVTFKDAAGAVMTPADLPQGMDLKTFAKLNDPLMHSNEMSDFSVHTYLPNTASYFLHEHDGTVMLMHRPDAVARGHCQLVGPRLQRGAIGRRARSYAAAVTPLTSAQTCMAWVRAARYWVAGT